MKKNKQSLLEDYGSKPVPEGKGKNWFQIGIIYWGSAICLPAFLIAGIIAGPAKLSTAIGAFIVGAVVLGAIAILIGVLGAQTRLSTGMSARFTFGKYGANVLQILLFLGLWGWFGVQLGFMVAGLGDGGLSFALGGAVPVWLLKVLGGILMTLTAMFGFKSIEKLSMVAIPLLLVIIIATIATLYSGEQSLAVVAAQSTDAAMPIGIAISIVIGTYIVGALIAPDITRYAKSKSAGGFGMVFGMLIGFPVVLILGAIMVKGAGGEMDFSKVMLMNNSGFWAFLAVVAIILAAWTTNDNNLYSGALSINAMFPKLNKWVITVASGAIGTILALLGINTAAGFQTFLGIVAILIPPAASIMILDYYLFKGKVNCYFDSDKIEESANFRALPFVAWIAGSAFGFIVQYTAVKLTGITALDTIIIAGVVFTAIMLIARKTSKEKTTA
ncbi:MAG: cytosine permease [Spirochaetales bacterium]|nr:cytosine permease [Spirochaetales bacterium]